MNNNSLSYNREFELKTYHDMYGEPSNECCFDYIIGVDEASTGALAGSVGVAACIIPNSVANTISFIQDSKKIKNHSSRKLIRDQLITHPQIKYHVTLIEASKIDEETNILKTTHNAMYECVNTVLSMIEPVCRSKVLILIDGNKIPHHLQTDVFLQSKTLSVIKGDAKCLSISAASIIAKTERDEQLINEIHPKFPHFKFDEHKGYHTKQHIELILKHKAIPGVHRFSFNPIKTWLSNNYQTIEKKSKTKTKNKKRTLDQTTDLE